MCNLSQALVEQGVQQGIQQGIQQGMQQGVQQGIQQGQDMIIQLLQKLNALGRDEDARRVLNDQKYRNALMKELL